MTESLLNIEDKLLQLEETNQELSDRLLSLDFENRAQSSLIDMLMTAAPVGIIIFDSNLQVLQINKMAEVILKLDRTSIIGSHCSGIFNCHDKEERCRALSGDCGILKEETTLEGNGTTILRSANKFERKGKQLIVESFVDISDIKRAQDEMHELNKCKDYFIAMTGHELKTPLNGILGFSEIIRDNIDSLPQDQIIEMANDIHESGGQLNRMISEIVQITALINKKETLLKETVNIRMLVENLLDNMGANLQKNNNEFEVRYADDLPTLTGDPSKIATILRNLINNAFKYTKDGKVSLKIRKQDDASQVSFDISDTGIGIEEKDLKRIFSPFEQGEQSLKRSFGGAGLGLSIANLLAELMGGNITATSESDKGSCFTFTLPVNNEPD